MRPRYNAPAMRAPLLFSMLFVGLAPLACASGCAGASTPPPGWQQGGAQIFLPRATWTYRYNAIELLPDGRVIVNERHAFTVDRVGRVMDTEDRPVALLRPDGRLVGGGGDDLGAVAPTTAALPGESYASWAIAPDGRVLKVDQGDPISVGSWAGCGYYAVTLQACMLVTLLVVTKFQPVRPLNRYPQTPYSSPFGTPYGGSMAPGIGVGIP